MQNVPQNLHLAQGVNHLNRVLNYAQLVAEEGRAIVYLTPEDWHVVLDTLFHMETPKEALPDEIEKYELTKDDLTIQLTTGEFVIELVQI